MVSPGTTMRTLSTAAILLAMSFCCQAPAQDKETESSPASNLLAEIVDTKVISWKPPLYHGWPTLVRRSNGELLLAFSGGREKHVCPFGRLEWMRSSDNGNSWGWPQVLLDSPIDDRDAGVLETAQGTILVTHFTSLAFESILAKAELTPVGQPGGFEEAKLLDEWKAARDRLSPQQRQSELGCYMIRSTDGGVTWSERYRVPVNSPHGPICTTDGRLIYAGKALWQDSDLAFYESKDDGISWEHLADLPIRPGDQASKYHELHMVDAGKGQWICHIRNQNPTDLGHTLQCESHDGGKTWTVPHSIGVWGLPYHLLRLNNGHLLMSYGHRKPPFGIQSRISRDQGATWSEPIVISSDGITGDLGYPSTIECSDGMLVTVWYEVLPGSPLAQLRQARWRLAQ